LKQIRDVLCALRPQHPPDDSIPMRDNSEIAHVPKAAQLKFKLDARTVMTSSSTKRGCKIKPKRVTSDAGVYLV